jgi:hypothetical protein
MARRGYWKLVLLLATVPRCSCLGCGSPEPSCNFSLGGGGGCTGGGGECANPPAGTHTVSGTSSGFFGSTCTLVCETGWSDCDNDVSNGCETPGACPKPHADAGAKPELLATLSGAPRGLAACDSGRVYFFDDSSLKLWSAGAAASVLDSTGAPSGGLACDATNLYWTTLSEPDGGPTGAVWSLAFDADGATAIASAVDPGRGIDVRSPRVYWIARTGLSDAGSMLAYSLADGGTVAVMPTTEGPAYKGFALSYDGDYAIASGSLWFNSISSDAGAPYTLDFDASAASALFAGAGGAYAVIHGAYPSAVDAGPDADVDASDASSEAAPDDAAYDAPDDASGDASTDAGADGEAGSSVSTDSIVALTGTPSPLFDGLAPIRAAIGNGAAIVASDDKIYYVDLPSGFVTVLATGALHVTDVAMDGTYAYWTTLGQGTTAAALWRIVLP